MCEYDWRETVGSKKPIQTRLAGFINLFSPIMLFIDATYNLCVDVCVSLSIYSCACVCVCEFRGIYYRVGYSAALNHVESYVYRMNENFTSLTITCCQTLYELSMRAVLADFAGR